VRRAAFFLAVTFLFGWLNRCAAADDDAERLQRVKKLYSEQDWEKAAREAHGAEQQPAELDYYEGMALPHLEQWREAREAFSRGVRKAPAEARFLSERAGAEYKLNDFGAAKKDLQKALRLDPGDSYIPEFLGTIYLLEGNLEAALKYWNKIQKPKLAAVELFPTAKTKKALLDRAVTFAPPGALEREHLLKTKALLENLDVFPRLHAELSPEREEGYKATLKLTERNGWGVSALDGTLSLLCGVPYDTLYPAWYGFGGRAVNFDSLLRWDPEKRRARASLEFPVLGQPARRLRLFFDARNENWDLSSSLTGGTTAITDLNLRRFAGGAELHEVENGWWDWSARLEVVSRDFRNVPGGLAAAAKPFLTSSRSTDASISLHRWLVRIPERRFTVEATSAARGGRSYASGLGAFGSIAGDVTARWLPKARGDDFEFLSRLRGADTFGDVPLDMLFELGVERDNELWLRGHDATTGGRKGRAPLGRRYLLWNAELNKTVHDSGFFHVQLGPFFDTGAVAEPSGLLGSRKWLFDTGLQARVRVLGSVSVVLLYGRDLRNGKGLFYPTSSR